MGVESNVSQQLQRSQQGTGNREINPESFLVMMYAAHLSGMNGK